MAVTPSNPHDALFRRILSRPANAISELRTALPAPLVARIDWDSLTPQSCSFVSTELRSRYSDLLFSTRLADHDAYIYLLIEHQSRPDRFMPLRMNEYLVAIWNRHLSEHPRARGLLGDHIPHLRLYLDDLATVDTEALRARPLTPATRLVFVFHRTVPRNSRLGTDLMPQVPDLQALLETPGGLDELRSLVKYIFLEGETSEDDLAPLIDQLGPRAKEVIMTTAEQLRTEGHAKGLAKGLAEGQTKARAEALNDLLTAKFGPVPAEVARRIADADSGTLRNWFRAALVATEVDEVFA